MSDTESEEETNFVHFLTKDDNYSAEITINNVSETIDIREIEQIDRMIFHISQLPLSTVGRIPTLAFLRANRKL